MNILKLRIIQFIGLFLLLLVTGTFWGTWFTLTRSLETFSAQEFIHIGKTIIENVAWPMRILMPLAILFNILYLWWRPRKRSVGFIIGLVACVFLIITLLITVSIEVPIDNQIKTWTPETVPGEWESLRDRWKLFHAIRTLTALLSFACFSASILFSRHDH